LLAIEEEMIMKAGKIRRSIQRFSDFTNDLIRADMNTFGDRLALLMNYCRTDEVFAKMNDQLLGNASVNFDEWYAHIRETIGSMIGSGNLTFPVDLDNRLSLMYQLLYRIDNNQLDLIDFSTNFLVTGSSRYDDYISAFNEAISQPLFREMQYRLQDLGDELPGDSSAEVPLSIIQIIQHAENVIQQNALGNGNQKSASILNGTNELQNLFDKLRAELSLLSIPQEEKNRHLEVIEASEALATQANPKKASVRALLSTLPALGNMASVVSAIISAIEAFG
jgi:hypothetical protein